MAEGGIAVDQDETETMSSFQDAPPSIVNVLVMTVEELRTELRVRGVAFSGGTKPELQVLLLQELGYGVSLTLTRRMATRSYTPWRRNCSWRRLCSLLPSGWCLPCLLYTSDAADE